MKSKQVVLIVDDDADTRNTFKICLEDDFSIHLAKSAEDAFHFLANHRVGVVLLDIKLPGMDGITALKKIRSEYPDTEVIMLSAIREAEMIFRASRAGAYHYCTKDIDPSEIALNIQNAMEKQQFIRENFYYKSEIEQYINKNFIVGKSAKMKSVYNIIEKTSGLDVSVLITGKSGTGKELIARTIHEKSRRKSKPFIAINMASIPENLAESILFGHVRGAFTGAETKQHGKFELADGGTIFLDEIGDLSKSLQVILHRVIQEGEIGKIGAEKQTKVDVRIIAATNVNFEQKMASGEFRSDLYYRLNVVPITLPTLFERIEDLPILVDFFIDRYRKKYNRQVEHIDKEALGILSNYNWPGNIRELENLIARIVAMSESTKISVNDIPMDYHLEGLINEKPSDNNTNMLSNAVEIFEKNCIIRALKKHDMSQKSAAAGLGIPYSTFKFKLKKFGIKKLLAEENNNN